MQFNKFQSGPGQPCPAESGAGAIGAGFARSSPSESPFDLAAVTLDDGKLCGTHRRICIFLQESSATLADSGLSLNPHRAQVQPSLNFATWSLTSLQFGPFDETSASKLLVAACGTDDFSPADIHAKVDWAKELLAVLPKLGSLALALVLMCENTV